MSYDGTSGAIIGESAIIRQLRAQIAKVGPTPLAVLIQGETGSGKELVAQALHAASGRRGPFVALNVCAVTETMFEATLFGHVRGAFTGAISDAPGYVAQAHLGTLFLDEIGGMPLSLQAKLLRVLESQKYRPVGASSDRHSDFRVIAATNEGIASLVKSGKMRRDLAHRLSAVLLEVPPLRRRLGDVPLLVSHFASRAADDGFARRGISSAAIDRLTRHEWPGNVRELRHVVELAITLAEEPVIGTDLIDEVLSHSSVLSEMVTADAGAPKRQEQKAMLLVLLAECEGDTTRVAARLGVDRRTVYRWMERLEIPTPKRSARRRFATPY